VDGCNAHTQKKRMRMPYEHHGLEQSATGGAGLIEFVEREGNRSGLGKRRSPR